MQPLDNWTPPTRSLSQYPLRLPAYRVSYRLRYHPYAGERPMLYNRVRPIEEDDSLSAVTHHQADMSQAVLEPFFSGENAITSSCLVPPSVKAEDGIEDVVQYWLVSIRDFVYSFRVLLQSLLINPAVDE